MRTRTVGFSDEEVKALERAIMAYLGTDAPWTSRGLARAVLTHLRQGNEDGLTARNTVASPISQEGSIAPEALSEETYSDGTPVKNVQDRNPFDTPLADEQIPFDGPAPVQTGAVGSVPGWKLVPVEPTDEMVKAARSAHEGAPYLPMTLYASMLAASPSPPVQERQGVGEFCPDWTFSDLERAIVALTLALPKHVPGWPGCTDEQMELVAGAVIAELTRSPPTVGGGE